MKTSNFIIIISFSLSALISCDSEIDNISFKEVGALIWVNESMSDSLVKIAVKETLQNSSLVISQISWSPTDRSFMKNVEWYYSLALESHKKFMLNIDWLENNRSDTRGKFDFENKEMRTLFINDIKNLINLYHPNYLTLGVEVNYYALTSPKGYREFIKVFNELKASIKEKEPKIKIGLSFQLELLYGVHKDWKQNKTIEPLNAIVENLDYIGISTYPDIFTHFNDRTFSSFNYLDSLKKNYKKPIGILETGISFINFKDNARVNYLKSIYKKANDLQLSFVVWGSIVDDPRQADWNHKLGLINSKGVSKPEFTIWKQENKKYLNN